MDECTLQWRILTKKHGHRGDECHKKPEVTYQLYGTGDLRQTVGYEGLEPHIHNANAERHQSTQ